MFTLFQTVALFTMAMHLSEYDISKESYQKLVLAYKNIIFKAKAKQPHCN